MCVCLAGGPRALCGESLRTEAAHFCPQGFIAQNTWDRKKKKRVSLRKLHFFFQMGGLQMKQTTFPFSQRRDRHF